MAACPPHDRRRATTNRYTHTDVEGNPSPPRLDELLGAFEGGLDLGAGQDVLDREQGLSEPEQRLRFEVATAAGARQSDAVARAVARASVGWPSATYASASAANAQGSKATCVRRSREIAMHWHSASRAAVGCASIR